MYMHFQAFDLSCGMNSWLVDWLVLSSAYALFFSFDQSYLVLIGEIVLHGSGRET